MRCPYLLILRVNQWLSWYKSSICAPKLTSHLGKFRICNDWEADNLRENWEYFLVRLSFRPSRGDTNESAAPTEIQGAAVTLRSNSSHAFIPSLKNQTTTPTLLDDR